MTEADEVANGPSFADKAPDFRAYWRTLVQHRWVALTVFVGVVLATAAYTYRQPRLYQAATTIIIENSAPRVLDDQQVQQVVEAGSGSYWFSKEFYETQYKVMQSRSVAARVAEKLKLREDDAFLGLEGVADPKAREDARAKADVTSMVQGRLQVEPVKESRLARLIVVDKDPKFAAALANAFAESYIDETLSVRMSTTQVASNWLEQQLVDLEKKVETSSQELHAFKQAHDIVSTSWEDKQNMVSQSLTKLNEQLTSVRANKAMLKARMDAFAEGRKEGGDLEKIAALVPQGLGEMVQAQKVRYIEARTECADLALRLLEQHPRYVACQEKLAAAREALQKEVDAVTAATRVEYNEAVATERNLLELFESTKSASFATNQHEPEYLRLRRAHETNLRLHDMVLKRLKEAGLAGMMQLSNVRILDRARPPGGPFKPNVRNNLLIGLVFAVLLAVGAAFGLDYLDNSVKSQEHVEERLGLTFLGILPSMGDPKLEGARDLTVFRNPLSAAAECCRAVRTNLLFMSPDKPLRTILVTSAGPRDGKTLTASSLAITMAESGNRVLLVDADMRRPRVHHAFDVPNTGVGLSALILNGGNLAETVRSTEVGNLFVLTCGAVPPNPAELLHTARFAELLKQMGSQFDKVIIDSPPVGAVADAVVISTQVDGTVLVLKSGWTSRDLARSTVRALTDVNARLLGAVLNDVNLEDRQAGYYYQQYGYYYGAREAKDQAVS